MTTDLVYLEDTELFKDTGVVERIQDGADGEVVIVLDRTIFYPQGGGQPTDRGTIESTHGLATIGRVSFINGEVFHSGRFTSGALEVGDNANLAIDADRRMLHARLHTGGHLIMTAVDRLLQLPALKGYHFPDGPYVEFDGSVPVEQREQFVQDIQTELDQIIAENSEVSWKFESVEVLREQGVYIPAEIPAGKPTRVVLTAGYYSPCGGTHVKHLGSLQGLRAKSIKVKSRKTRVSYYFEGENES